MRNSSVIAPHQHDGFAEQPRNVIDAKLTCKKDVTRRQQFSGDENLRCKNPQKCVQRLSQSLRHITKLMSPTRQEIRHKPHHPRQFANTARTTVKLVPTRTRCGNQVTSASDERYSANNCSDIDHAKKQVRPLQGTARAKTRVGRSSDPSAILHAAVYRTAVQWLKISAPRLTER